MVSGTINCQASELVIHWNCTLARGHQEPWLFNKSDLNTKSNLVVFSHVLHNYKDHDITTLLRNVIT